MSPIENRRLAWLSGIYACGSAMLLGATRRLWIGQDLFPQIPLFGFAVAVPSFVDAALLALMVSALFLTFIPRTRRTAWVAFAAAWALSAVLDQHRIQVWAWHLALCSLVIAVSKPNDAFRRLQWITIGIYFWSALSRADTTFIHGIGSRIAESLAVSVGIEQLSPRAAVAISSGFPIGEALVALLLSFERTRRLGLVASILMHGCLLMALGPLGLDHEWGVLLWNAVLTAQNLLLFGPNLPSTEPELRPGILPRALRGVARTVLVVAIGMPALQPLGYWDVWPSWAVYSSRGGSATVSVHADDAGAVPPQTVPWLLAAPPLSDWRPVDVDAWSRTALHCPANPDSRFRFAVARQLSSFVRVRIDLRSAPHRWTGQWESCDWELPAGQATPQIDSRFWLNLEARRERR